MKLQTDLPNCTAQPDQPLLDPAPSLPPSAEAAGSAIQDDLAALAQAGSPSAQAKLGDQLLYGKGCPANQPQGISWLCKAGLAGDLDAMLGLGRWYMTRTPSYSLDQARFWIAKALATGSPLAQECMGDAVLALNLGPECVAKAAQHYKTGARSNPNCLAKLLELHYKGMLGAISSHERRICFQRLETLASQKVIHALRVVGERCLVILKRKAVTRLRQGAELGERTCQRKLALAMARTKTSIRAMKEAWHWMSLAAQDDPEAQYELGVWLAKGRGCKADPKQAEHYLRLASYSLPKALVKLGILLADDADEARKAEGLAMLGKAASLGLSEACFELGVRALASNERKEAADFFQQAGGSHGPSLRKLAEMALDEAHGQNDGKAWDLMAQAAGLGDAEAMLALARRKLAMAKQAGEGEGAHALRREAYRLLQGACRKNHSQAMYELALLAEAGASECGCAKTLHAKAARLGHLGSMECHADALLNEARAASKDLPGPATKGHGLTRAGKAAKILRQAAGLGSAACACKYGALLEEGYFVPQNLPLALSWYGKAAAKGDSEGHCRLGMLLLKMGGPREAEGWAELAKAAGLRHPDARTALARRSLACGDRNLAGDWLEAHLQRLADQNSPEGMFLLSEALDRKWFQSRRLGEGHSMLVKAADMGNVDALLRLGDMHAFGRGIDQNREKARVHYAKAFMLGSREAGERLKSLPVPNGNEPWMGKRLNRKRKAAK